MHVSSISKAHSTDIFPQKERQMNICILLKKSCNCIFSMHILIRPFLKKKSIYGRKLNETVFFLDGNFNFATEQYDSNDKISYNCNLMTFKSNALRV